MSAISDRFMSKPKERSSPSKLTYSRVTPIGSSGAKAGETIRLRLANMRVGAYLDPTQSFISFKLKSSDAVVATPYSGTSAIFRTAIVRCAGQQLSIIDQYQLYRNILARSYDKEFLANDGNILSHMNSNGVGEGFTAGEEKQCVELLSNFSPLFQSETYVPLFSNDSLELDLVVGDPTYAFAYATLLDANNHTVKSDAIELSDITVHCAIVEVPQDVDRQIVSAHNGLWQFYNENVQYVPFSLNSGSSSAVLNLGLSMSSLTKLDMVFTAQTDASTLPLDVFAKNDLAKAELLIDGVPVLPMGIDCKSDAVTVAYSRIARHGLSDAGLFENRTLSTFQTNDFIVSFDLESIVRKEGLRSGINVSSSTVQLVLTFGTPLPAQTNVHCYATHDALVSFDASASGTRTFEISI